jgi:hypothetical protein
VNIPVVWREIDHERREFGIRIWATGGEISVGRRMYRALWRYR